MRYIYKILLAVGLVVGFSGCLAESQEAKDSKMVEQQQKQYSIGQPVPQYDWSLERDLLIKLYDLRNEKVSTHSVWRSNYGIVEGDCTSMGYGLPYDTSLTNPYQIQKRRFETTASYTMASGVVGQTEPNGVFASTNTSATWVMCLGVGGNIEPHYIESKVAVYPYPIKVDFDTNRVSRAGKTSASIRK